MRRVAVFLDGSNFFFTQKLLGWSIDAEKLLDYCKQYGDVVEATYYTGISENGNQRKYFGKLGYIGYSLVTKPIKTVHDNITGQVYYKANLDTEIVLDMFNMIDRYDMAILISGDSDFERAVQQLKSRGKEVKVISGRGCVSSELVFAAGVNYVDFDEIRSLVERKDKPHPFNNIAA